MRNTERDELEREKVNALHRLAHVIEAPERAKRQRALDAAFPPFRRLFGSERGAVALLRGIPGFAALWEKVVPDVYVRETLCRAGERWQLVACPCGEHPALRPGAIADCPGGCGRFFFATGRLVRVKQFDLGASDAAAA